MDRRLLLLPNRNGYAQFAAPSHSTRESGVEETTIRATRVQDR